MIELPQGYYLTNFLELVDYVVEQYSDLLSGSERQFYTRFKNLDQPAQFLYVRMLTRKGVVFRGAKLQYNEIPDIHKAAEHLQRSKLIEIDGNLEISDFIHAFSKPEWLKILSQLPLDKATQSQLKKLSRHDLDTVICEIGEDFDLTGMIDEHLYQINKPETFETFKLLFFGNLNQDLTEFVLRDLGLYRFEDYHIDQNARLFESREQINNYLHYYQLIADLDLVLASDSDTIIALHQALPDAKQQDDTLNRRIQRVNLQLARQLERLDALDKAIEIYQTCQLPPARERTARILARQNNVKQSLEMCQQILLKPVTESESIFAADFGYRTARKHKIDWPKPAVYTPPTEIITIEQSDNNVESDVASYLAEFGQCTYVENALFLSVFGLHFWELFFAPVRGAFTNPFQVRPHDLYDDNFITKRQSLFEQLQRQLGEINDRAPHYLKLLEHKIGTATPFIFWDIMDENLIKLALSRIPQSHWQAVFNRLWKDIRANRSGFPDLVLFPEKGGYQLVEVKGPGDRLQKNQLRWLQFFAEHDIPHKVIHVEWQ